MPQALNPSAGVDGFVAIAEACKAGRAFLSLGVQGLKKHLKSDFLVLLHRFSETRFVRRESFNPAFLLEFFLSGHVIEKRDSGLGTRYSVLVNREKFTPLIVIFRNMLTNSFLTAETRSSQSKCFFWR